LLRPKRVLPIHYNTFELITQDPIAWSQRVQGQTGVPVSLLKPGQSLTL
jgi:L-ascorbate metabolism protein UlaG (beta-lactamase superfamily)